MGFGEHEAAIAVAALDEIRVAHLQPDAGMAKNAADAVTRHAARRNRDDFRGRGIGGRQGGGLSDHGARLGGGPSSA